MLVTGLDAGYYSLYVLLFFLFCRTLILLVSLQQMNVLFQSEKM